MLIRVCWHARELPVTICMLKLKAMYGVMPSPARCSTRPVLDGCQENFCSTLENACILPLKTPASKKIPTENLLYLSYCRPILYNNKRKGEVKHWFPG